MQRTYIVEGFSRKDEIKSCGGLFDGGDDARGFTRSGYTGYIDRRNACMQRCFETREYGCGACERPERQMASAVFMPKPDVPDGAPCPHCRRLVDPAIIENLGRCLPCDMDITQGFAITAGEEQLHRAGGGRCRCLRCGRNLVPTGDQRANGSRRFTDNRNRDYHVKCLKEEMRGRR